jgi:hypothetical protein
MTITKLCLIKFTGDGYIDGRTYTQVYSVEFTGEWDPVLLETGEQGAFEWPTYLDLLPGTATSCVNIKSDLVDASAKLGTITCLFKSNSGFATADRDHCAFVYSQEQRDIMYDTEDKPLLTAANQVFAQPGVISKQMLGATITGYRSTVMFPPPSDWHIVNAAPFTLKGYLIGAGQARIAGGGVEDVVVNGVPRLKHTWQLAFRKDHDLHVPNMGTVQLNAGGKQVAILDAQGQPVTTPWPLDIAGHALEPGYTIDDVVKIDFDVTEDYDFSGFNWTFA